MAEKSLAGEAIPRITKEDERFDPSQVCAVTAAQYINWSQGNRQDPDRLTNSTLLRGGSCIRYNKESNRQWV